MVGKTERQLADEKVDESSMSPTVYQCNVTIDTLRNGSSVIRRTRQGTNYWRIGWNAENHIRSKVKTDVRMSFDTLNGVQNAQTSWSPCNW